MTVPAVGGTTPGEHAHGGRLAGAVAAEQRGRLAGVRLEVDAGDGLDLAEAHVQAAHVDDRGLVHAENPPSGTGI